MAKIRLTKTELKAQRDNLKRFGRYLPTLQLKKQQLQLETNRVRQELAGLETEMEKLRTRLREWAGLVTPELAERAGGLLEVLSWEVGDQNVAGVDTPVFLQLNFGEVEYDLFEEPILLDDVVETIRTRVEQALHRQLLEEQLTALETELRITTQRVNLFEKVKIPEAKDNIRRIQIYLGDQQTSAVCRAKIAKEKNLATTAAQ